MAGPLLDVILDNLKILPTKDYEYWALADQLEGLHQVLSFHKQLLFDGANLKEESLKHFWDLLVKLVDSLKYHLVPYLEETGVSDLQAHFLKTTDEQPPKQSLVYRYLELLIQLCEVD